MLQDLKTQFGQSMKSVQRLLKSPVKLGQGGNLMLGVPKDLELTRAQEEARHHRRLMTRDLDALLSQHPSSRRLVRHLAVVEHTLRTKGLKGFDALPARVIAKALTDLDSLVRDWSPAGLAELRSRMAVIVKARPPSDEPVSTMMDLMSDTAEIAEVSHADISEVDHAEFEEMERSWVGVMPDAVRKQQANA